MPESRLASAFRRNLLLLYQEALRALRPNRVPISPHESAVKRSTIEFLAALAYRTYLPMLRPSHRFRSLIVSYNSLPIPKDGLQVSFACFYKTSTSSGSEPFKLSPILPSTKLPF